MDYGTSRIDVLEAGTTEVLDRQRTLVVDQLLLGKRVDREPQSDVVNMSSD